MKFQNCILIKFERTQRRMEGRKDKPKAICPFNVSKVGGIKRHNVFLIIIVPLSRPLSRPLSLSGCNLL